MHVGIVIIRVCRENLPEFIYCLVIFFLVLELDTKTVMDVITGFGGKLSSAKRKDITQNSVNLLQYDPFTLKSYSFHFLPWMKTNLSVFSAIIFSPDPYLISVLGYAVPIITPGSALQFF